MAKQKNRKKDKKETASKLAAANYFVPFFTGDFLPIPPVMEHFNFTSLERAIIPRNHFEPIVRG